MKELMTIEEAAACLHETVKVSTVRRAIKRGDLPAKKIGKRYYITKSALMGFAKCQDHGNQPACSTERTRTSGSYETIDRTIRRACEESTIEMLLNRP